MRPTPKGAASWAQWSIALLALPALLGCQAEPPKIIDLHSPGPTRDTAGPYQVAISTSGPVDRVQMSWAPARRGETVPLRMHRAGGAYVGLLPGRPPGETQLQITVSGPGGEVSALRTTRIIGNDSVCLVDGDCPPFEYCDRIRRRCRVALGTCDDDGDCPQDYVCDVGQTACRFRPSTCQQDEACPIGYRCLNGVCASAPECADDAGCPELQRCIRPGRCVDEPECEADAQCPEGSCQSGLCVGGCACAPDELCQGARCVAVGPPCGGPCPAGSQCDETLGACIEACPGGCPERSACLDGRCAADCPADANEPNDRAAQSTPFRDGAVGVICPADDRDLFTLPARPSPVLEVETDGPLSVVFLDEAEQTLTTVEARPGASEFGLPPGAYYVAIGARAPGDSIRYALGLSTPRCVEDGLEENDRQPDATALGSGAQINAMSCPGDADWYLLRLRPGRRGTVTFDPVEALEWSLWSGPNQLLGSGLAQGPTHIEVSHDPDGLFLTIGCPRCARGVRYRLLTDFNLGR